MANITYCSPDIFEIKCRKLAICISRMQYTSIYGIPRGGVYIAIRLAQLLNLPIIEKIGIHKATLIVDDLIDSGRTRNRYPGNDFACLYNKLHTPLLPRTTVSDTIDGWVEFFWEKGAGEQPAEDAVIRMLELKNLKCTKKTISLLYAYINEFLIDKETEWKQ